MFTLNFIFQPLFNDKSDRDIIREILNSEHVYKRIQLLGILLKRHDENFPISSETTGERLLRDK